MSLLGAVIDVAAALRCQIDVLRQKRRWAKLRSMGMRIGEAVNLPASTAIDTSHCFLISIGDWCGFEIGRAHV